MLPDPQPQPPASTAAAAFAASTSASASDSNSDSDSDSDSDSAPHVALSHACTHTRRHTDLYQSLPPTLVYSTAKAAASLPRPLTPSLSSFLFVISRRRRRFADFVIQLARPRTRAQPARLTSLSLSLPLYLFSIYPLPLPSRPDIKHFSLSPALFLVVAHSLIHPYLFLKEWHESQTTTRLFTIPLVLLPTRLLLAHSLSLSLSPYPLSHPVHDRSFTRSLAHFLCCSLLPRQRLTRKRADRACQYVERVRGRAERRAR
jgi:hypothetical protein